MKHRIVEIFDKGEREHTTYFILNVFDDFTVQEVKMGIKRVHDMEDYSIFDLKTELENIKRIDRFNFSYIFDGTDDINKNKIELGF